MCATVLRHAAQRVRAERRVVKMHRQILEHQVERVRRVFQVMDEKRGHGLERFEFLGLQKFLRQARVEQAGGNVVADALEQIKILPGERRAR